MEMVTALEAFSKCGVMALVIHVETGMAIVGTRTQVHISILHEGCHGIEALLQLIIFH